MKNLKKFLQAVIIFLFVLIDMQNEYSKNIIVGLYVLFPILFIIQGLVINNKKDLYVGLAVSSITVVTIAIFYNMGTTIVPAIIYLVLGVLAGVVKMGFKTLLSI